MQMNSEYHISIVLDKRRKKQNGKFPVKLRVFTPSPRVQKLYSINFDMTEVEFANVWETLKPKREHKEIKLKLQSIEIKAIEIAENLKYFTFESFENSWFNKSSVLKNNINSYYDEAIEQYKINNQIGTAVNYEYSIKSLMVYNEQKSLNFQDVTVQWLKGYERFMIDTMEKSQTTVGIYLRPLRAIFNKAKEDRIINAELYPFGKRKYSIPAPNNVKKALSPEHLKLLFESVPVSIDQQKAKDFWFFSYFGNGMNIKDIANLRYKDLTEKLFYF